MIDSSKLSTRQGLKAISPMIFFILFYFGASIASGQFGTVSIPIAFLMASIYGICILPSKSVKEKIRIFSRGAGSNNVLLIVWIFFLAGIFSEVAKQTGCFEETVGMTLNILPPNYIYAGLFLTACIVSMATGTALGTVVTLAPIGVELCSAIGGNMPLTVAIIVGGSFFGDNLSFISDTTIVATSTQECKMADKFKVNLRIILPAAIMLFFLYIWLGKDLMAVPNDVDVNYIKVLPYAAVIVMAMLGINVMVVLMTGIVAAAVIGMSYGSFDFFGLLSAMNSGLFSMQEVCIIAILASGMMEIIKENGGLDFLLDRLSRIIMGKRSAEIGIALLVSVANICTAMNTVAILSVSSVAKEISIKYGLDNRKVASILDTFSCSVQGLLPYGAHLLVGTSFAGLTTLDIIPYLYYPMLIGISATIAIIFRLPRKYS